MPFTVSHTAAVLPFARFLRRFKLLSAAVIGSMAPDFGIFMGADLPRYETHSFRALFEFCLPLGLAVYWLFELHIKPATWQILPDRLFERWREDAAPAAIKSVSQWFYAAVGLLLGGVTHLIWDGFTHENARGVQLLPIFDGWSITLAGHPFSWFRFAQHTSSVLGLLFVLWYLAREVRGPAPASPPSRPFDQRQRRSWFLVYVGVAALSALLLGALTFHQFAPGFGLVMRAAAVSSLWGTSFSLIFVSALIRIRLRTTPPAQLPPR
jgi:hypothetical protein